MATSNHLQGLRILLDRIDSPATMNVALERAVRLLTLGPDFSVATASIVRPGGFCQTLAVSAPEQLQAALKDTRFSTRTFTDELTDAERWGLLRFVPLEQSMSVSVLHPAGMAFRHEAGPLAGTLYAPLNDDAGRLLGVIAVGVPDGKPRPGIAAQRLLAEVSKAVAGAIEVTISPDVQPADGSDQDSAEPAGRRSAESAGGRGAEPADGLEQPATTGAGRPVLQSASRHSAAPAVAVDPEMRDAVTGLPNLQGLASSLGTTLTRLRQDGSTAAVLVCVLEEFDAIADRFGADIAEQVLHRVSARMQEEVRTYDVVGRMSHNTMAVVADRIAPADTRSLAVRLRRSLAKVHVVNNQVIRVRGAVGVAVVDADTSDEQQVFEQAQSDCETERSGAHGTYVLFSRYTEPQAAGRR